MKKTTVWWGLLAGALLWATGARAVELPMEGRNAEGTPGTRVFLELLYDYRESIKVTVEDLALDYPGQALAFVPDASKLELMGSERSLTQYVSELQQFAQSHFGTAVENRNQTFAQSSRKGYALSFFTADGHGHPRAGQARLLAAFDILPAALPGDYVVSFGRSSLVDDLDVEYSYGVQSLVVTVVPEPSMALLLLSGGLLVIGCARRRSRGQTSA